MAVLLATDGGTPAKLIPLDQDTLIFGRHPECNVVLQSAAVSRQHARILQVDGKFYIEDLHSRNGTSVNGKPVRRRQLLAENDRIVFCDAAFVFLEKAPKAGDALADSTAMDREATAMVIEDEPAQSDSVVVSRLDVSAISSRQRLEANPQLKLKALVEISQSLSGALQLDEVLPKLLDGLFAIFTQADRGVLLFRDAATGRLVPKAVKHRRPELADTVRVSRTIVQGVMASREAILSVDAESDARFNSADSVVDFHIRSLMCAPLVDRAGNVVGVLQLDTQDRKNRFSREDLDVLASVASQAAVAVENAQLHEAAVREQALSRELSVAHDVLRGFLPAGRPEIDQYEFFDFYEPAHELGGDYYDYVPLSGQRLAVVVADVSGKGIPASLLMAKLSAETRYCLASEASPAAAVARLNRGFCNAGWEDRFVTLVLAVLDIRQHTVTLVNAGHPPPLLVRGNQVTEVADEASTRLPLGVDHDVDYVQTCLSLSAGDCLALYTDGITEAMNEHDDLYGRERLLAQFAAEARGVVGRGRRILGDVKRFAGSRSQSDDMCLVCFGREGGERVGVRNEELEAGS